MLLYWYIENDPNSLDIKMFWSKAERDKALLDYINEWYIKSDPQNVPFADMQEVNDTRNAEYSEFTGAGEVWPQWGEREPSGCDPKISLADWDGENDTPPIGVTLSILPDKLELDVSEGPKGQNRGIFIEQTKGVIKVHTYGGEKDEPTTIVMEPNTAPRFEMED